VGTKRVLFIDRDGTLIHEPADQQVDSLEKLTLAKDVVPSLLRLQADGFRLVMVTNQDGLGTESFPQAEFDAPHDFLMRLLTSQGIRFDDVLICPHRPADGCFCRKPNLGLVTRYLSSGELDLERSCVIGDRDTDVQLARNMGIASIKFGGETGWAEITRRLLGRTRVGKVERKTKETRITAEVDLDDTGSSRIETGIGYFDHMLEQVAKHGGFKLSLSVMGDLHVDEHHTVEDTALALGEALRKALGDKTGIGRYGFLLPMDEAEAKVSLDLSSRPYFVFKGNLGREYVGELPTELVPHFFRSLAETLGAALHIEVTGENAHHMVESCFKGVGRALRTACARTGESDVPSTKGTL
jgi:imidazoleglycerol-phosphate dehydratase/histidinol-phosphatase